MRTLNFMTMAAALLLGASGAAQATLISLENSTSGSFTAACSGGNCTLTEAGTVSGTTSTGGTYSFAGVNVTLDTCSVATGCPTLVSGSRGQVTVNGTTYTLTSLTLDGDGVGVDFVFGASGLGAPNDVTLNTATTFSSLFTTSGTTGVVAVSSGEVNTSPVPEPGTLGLLGAGILGMVWAVRRRNSKGVAHYA